MMDAVPETPRRRRGRPPKPKKPKAPKTESKVASRSPGQPTKYTEEIGELICKRLAAGETLRAICRDPGMPTEGCVRTWARDESHPFAAEYDRARELGYHSMADEIFDIADDSRNDWVERQTKNGGTIRVIDEEAISRAKLRCAVRQWHLSKCLPKIYGDRLVSEINLTATLHTEPASDTKEWIAKVLAAQERACATNVIDLTPEKTQP